MYRIEHGSSSSSEENGESGEWFVEFEGPNGREIGFCVTWASDDLPPHWAWLQIRTPPLLMREAYSLLTLIRWALRISKLPRRTIPPLERRRKPFEGQFNCLATMVETFDYVVIVGHPSLLASLTVGISKCPT